MVGGLEAFLCIVVREGRSGIRGTSTQLVARLPQSDVSASTLRTGVLFLVFETDWAPVSFVSIAGGGAPDRAGRHERPGPAQAARHLRRGARSAGRDGLSGHGDRAALGKGPKAIQGPVGSPIGHAQPPAGRPLLSSLLRPQRFVRSRRARQQRATGCGTARTNPSLSPPASPPNEGWEVHCQ